MHAKLQTFRTSWNSTVGITYHQLPATYGYWTCSKILACIVTLQLNVCELRKNSYKVMWDHSGFCLADSCGLLLYTRTGDVIRWPDVLEQNILAGFASFILSFITKNRVLTCASTVIDHRRRHCVRRTKSHSTRLCLLPYFFLLIARIFSPFAHTCVCDCCLTVV